MLCGRTASASRLDLLRDYILVHFASGSLWSHRRWYVATAEVRGTRAPRSRPREGPRGISYKWPVFARCCTKNISDLSWRPVNLSARSHVWPSRTTTPFWDDLVYDPATMDGQTSVLAEGASLEPIASGLLFAEGPVWDATRGSLLFSDIAGDTKYFVVHFQPVSGRFEAQRNEQRFDIRFRRASHRLRARNEHALAHRT